MIPQNQKTSLLIAQQLPGFIRDEKDYETFVSFLQAYYEFLETDNNVLDKTKNLLNYKDVDNTIDDFEKHFFEEFLQNFPEKSLTDKRELVKFSKEIYQRKATPASFKFLFRALFNSDSDVFNAKDYVLIASGGKWNRSSYLRLSSLDERFLRTKNFKVFGETTRSVAKIENVQITSNRVEIYISDIIRNFIPGEFVKIVDNDLKEVKIDEEILRAKLIGSVQKINVIPGFEGSGYKVGDPVLVLGGTNPEKENLIKATAEVSSVGAASIQQIEVIDGSNGYRNFPNTIITVASPGTGANVKVAGLDASNPALVNHLLISDFIEPFANVALDANTYGFSSNTSANLLSELIYTFGEIDAFETYPISSLQIISGGSNYDSNTVIFANSFVSFSNNSYDISSFGILKPIKILYGGANYSNGDEVLITGGSGFGAQANISSVDINGTIESISYINKPNSTFTFGGLRYTENDLPTISVSSANNKVVYLSSSNTTTTNSNIIYFPDTSNVKVGMYVSGNGISSSNTFGYFDTSTKVTSVEAGYIQISTELQSESSGNSIYKFDGTSLLYVDGILGKGAAFKAISDKIGEVKSIRVINQGEDYVTTPSVSLKIIDVILINVDESKLPLEGEIIYQNDAVSPTFRAVVENVEIVPDELLKTHKLRLHTYIGTLSNSLFLYIDRTTENAKDVTLEIRTDYSKSGFVSGVKYFGDGLARANAEFTSGVLERSGQYVNTDGFLSDSNLLESGYVNEYSYFLVVQQEFSRYKTLLHNILHPSGKQYVNFDYIKSNNSIETSLVTEINKEIDLKLVTREPVYGVLTEPSKLNIYELRADLTDISLDAVVSSNDYIHLESDNGEVFYSKVDSIDNANNIIYLIDGNLLEYPNVAYGYTETTNNTIKITSLTGSFDLINGGNYTNANNYLFDIVFPGDYITISNNSVLEINDIDYSNNVIYANGSVYSSGNVLNPELITITRNFSSNTILINYNTVYKYLLGYGNTVTSISIDGFELHDENDNVIYIPLKI